MLRDKNHKVRETNTYKAQNFQRIRVRKYSTGTSLEETYINGIIQTGNDIVCPQDGLYSIAWYVKSNPSVLDHPKIYRDLLTIENTDI